MDGYGGLALPYAQRRNDRGSPILESERIQQALEQLKADNGSQALCNPQSLRGLLNDALGADARKQVLEVNLLVMAIEVWVASELPIPSTHDPRINRDIAARLVGERGISRAHAHWAVDSLAAVICDRRESAPAEPSRSSTEIPVPGGERTRRFSPLAIVLAVSAIGAIGVGTALFNARAQQEESSLFYEAFALGNGVIVRAGPSTQSEIVGSVASGGSMEIICVTRGEMVLGLVAGTDVWNKSREPAGFVSGAYLEIENQGRGLPECPDMPPFESPTPGQQPLQAPLLDETPVGTSRSPTQNELGPN